MGGLTDLVFDRSPRQVLNFLRRKALGHKRLRGFDDRHPCVFVLSTGRVGTETLAALLGLAGNVFSYHEPLPSLYPLSRLSYDHISEANVRNILLEAFRAARTSLLEYSLDCGRGYVETSPQTTFLAPVIAELIPAARFIHLVRDPRDVVRSGMRRKWFDGNPADKTRIVPLPSTSVSSKWADYDPYEKNIWLWTETNRWIMQFMSALSLERRLMVRSEEIFSADSKKMECLFSFIGSSSPPTRKLGSILGKKLNAQKSGQFPKSSSWTEEMKKDLTVIAGETASLLGYDLSGGS